MTPSIPRTLTIISITWLTILAFVEFLIGERNGIAAMVAYIPQHPLALPLVVSLVTSILSKRVRLILVNFLLVLVFLVAFMGFRLHVPGKGDPEAVRVMTWNVHGENLHLDGVMRVVKENDPDVLCIQEVRSGSPLLKRLKDDGWDVASVADVAIASKRPMKYSCSSVLLPGSGRRALMARLDMEYTWIDVWCVHFATNLSGASRRHPLAYLKGSARSRSIQMARLMKVARKSSTIIAGDFNTPPRGVVFRRLTNRYRDAFNSGCGFGYTYRSNLPLLRIDHILATRDLMPLWCRTVRTGASDHRPVITQMGFFR